MGKTQLFKDEKRPYSAQFLNWYCSQKSIRYKFLRCFVNPITLFPEFRKLMTRMYSGKRGDLLARSTITALTNLSKGSMLQRWHVLLFFCRIFFLYNIETFGHPGCSEKKIQIDNKYGRVKRMRTRERRM